MNESLATRRQPNSQIVSVRELPRSELTTAILSPNDPGKTLNRVNAVLALYFDHDLDRQVWATLREEYIRALAGYPDWAVMRAFDTWSRTGVRRPTPGEIVILASREVDPLHKELARRDRLRAEDEAAAAERKPCAPEQASALMIEAGFTVKRMEQVRAAPMALSFAEAEARATFPDATAAKNRARLEPGGEWAAAVEAARAANPIIQEARAEAARREVEERHSMVGLGGKDPAGPLGENGPEDWA